MNFTRRVYATLHSQIRLHFDFGGRFHTFYSKKYGFTEQITRIIYNYG